MTNKLTEYSQMVNDLAKPGEDIIVSLTPIKAHTLHMAIGLSGEVAELKEHQLMGEGDKLALESTVLEELGDIEFYFEGLCQSMKMEMEPSGIVFNFPLSVDQLVVAAGDMLDLVKKIIIYNKDLSLMQFVQQLIKVRECIDKVYSYYGITQAEAHKHNMHKLLKGKKARYKGGSYSDQAAQERSDKKGTDPVRYADTSLPEIKR